MQTRLITGIPAALLKNHLQYLTQKQKKSIYYSVRWNQDLQKYWDTIENIAEYKFAGAVRTIVDCGYHRVPQIQEQGEYSIKGDVITIWVIGFKDPLKLSYFGDDIEKIETFDLLTGRSQLAINQVFIGNLTKLAERSDWDNLELELAFSDISSEIQVLTGQLETDVNSTYDFSPPALYFQRFDLLTADINKYISQGLAVFINTIHPNSLPTELVQYTKTKLPADLPLLNLEKMEIGFISSQYKLAIFTDRELFGTIFVSPARRKRMKSSEAQKLLAQLEGEIEVGDFLVHEDYGVGIYHGFVIEDGQDYLKLEYAEADELYVPLEQLYKLTKYIGDETPHLTRLGKTEWGAIRKSVRAQVVIAAQELARHYAQTKLSTAVPVEKEDSEGYKSFIAGFEYDLTSDQEKSEREIIKDLAKTTPMSRLLIGDVGYGKTEIILRAAYKVAEAGCQAIVLCPTTVLALQHHHTFKKRFKDTPFTVGLLSRRNTPVENTKQLEAFSAGKIDILVGTHRLLSVDVQPKKLGMLVVDEEQRFGVGQKEKIRKLEHGVHSLYVTATPIPRTLSMALAAITDISFIQTPPPGRLPVNTAVQKMEWEKVSRAIQAEVDRGGQVFFVHNQIETISSVLSQLQNLLPAVRFVVGHGQMPAAKLDEIFTDFYLKKYDCLIATTIIENGLDMPNVNTLIVNNSQRLGLAQMYQLRGRVGRSPVQAYAYFFYKGRSWEADKELQDQAELNDLPSSKVKPAKYLDRLEAILSAQELGSGFKIASRDIEIRGAGNLLGAEQHGNIKKIGYSLYMQMLAEEIEKLKAELG